MSEQLINGESVARLPTIEVAWDAENQLPHLNFQIADFRTWDFVIAVLGMAVRAAEQNHRMALLTAAQQAGVEHAQSEAIRRRLMRG